MPKKKTTKKQSKKQVRKPKGASNAKRGLKGNPDYIQCSMYIHRDIVTKFDEVADAIGLSRQKLVSDLMRGFNAGADDAFIQQWQDMMSNATTKAIKELDLED